MTDSIQPEPSSSAETWLPSGGEMGARIRAFDWARHPLGPIEGWPQNLKTVTRIMLTSRYPMFVWWGDELTILYNDAYAPIFGAKHPTALGQSARRVWSEIWEDLAAQVDAVMREGRASWNEEGLLFMERNGFPEEVYFTWSYSPVWDEGGRVGGLFCACTEETSRVLGRRRLKTLRDLGERSLEEAKTAEQACRAAVAPLAENPNDLPFALIYLLDENGRQARLCEAIGLPAGTPASPAAVSIGSGGDVWDFRHVLDANQGRVIENLDEKFGQNLKLPAGVWSEDWTKRGLVLPLAKTGVQEFPAGFLVAGLSPRLLFDDDYRGFLELVAGQIATAIASARAYEEERRRAEALAELDRAKTAFFSNVSHEFRTPLTLMLGPLEETLAQGDGRLPPEERERIKLVHRNGLRLLKLVNTLLDFSRLEAGRQNINLQPTDLGELTAELASNFRAGIERAGMRLIVNCPPLSQKIVVDREMWEKIVLNLVSNAFKYTLKGEIEISLTETAEAVELRVRDTGAGIPAADLPHIFERFYRIRSTQGRTHEGTGIGLSLVRELVRMHEGAIEVESKHWQGSTFTVKIPKAIVPAGAGSLAPRRTAVALAATATDATGATAYVEEALRWLPSETERVGDGEIERQVDPVVFISPSPTLSVSPSSARILLADDNADMREYVRRLLSPQYEVEAVADGATALEAARRRAPDLILTDVMMPGLDGFELLAALRADEALRDAPVILLSARAGEESKIEGLVAGADDYLIKPFSARELLARVEAHLRLQRLRRESARQTRENEERLRLATEAARLGPWERDLVAHRLIASDQLKAIYGLAPEAEFMTESEWEQWLHPDDRARVAEALRQALAGEREYETEYRIRRANGRGGEWRWLHSRGRVLRDESGRPTRMLGVAMDITDRKRVEEQITRLLTEEQAAREAAEYATRAKDEFLTVVSHELRSPLNAILGWTRALRAQRKDDSEINKITGIIERSGRTQIQLIEDLLDTARIITGKLKLEVGPVDLAEVTAAALDTMRPAAEAKGIQLRIVDCGLRIEEEQEGERARELEIGQSAIRNPQSAIQVMGDADRLQQIVWNLLSNAVKFTPEGGRVQIALSRQESSAQIVVSDTGKGITPELLPYVFDRFRQGDSSSARRFGGLGLGLALVRHLVELHGGEVKVESGGEGQGATFTVSLPLRVRDRELRVEDRGTTSYYGSHEPSSSTLHPPSLVLKGLRILVVDDDEAARELVTLMLGQFGALAVAAGSAAAALAALEDPEARFDVVVSDIGMPGEDGYEFMRRVRTHASKRVRGIRAIALTAYACFEDRLRALEAGYQTHVPKPVEEDELITVIASLTGRIGRP